MANTLEQINTSENPKTNNTDSNRKAISEVQSSSVSERNDAYSEMQPSGSYKLNDVEIFDSFTEQDKTNTSNQIDFSPEQSGDLYTSSLKLASGDSSKTEAKVSLENIGAELTIADISPLKDLSIENSQDGKTKLENFDLPALRKGWGPFQALKKMVTDGRLDMGHQDMVSHASRIRDREFQSGKKYFSRGQVFKMYSNEEMSQFESDSGGNQRKYLKENIDSNESVDRPNRSDKDDSGESQNNIVRDISDRSRFYKPQSGATSCSAFAMSMMKADHMLGRPVNSSEAQQMVKVAGVSNSGYRKGLEGISSDLESQGLSTKMYKSEGYFDDADMADLNRELDQGHSAVARVKNPGTGNSHYIYVAGRDSDGNYIIGDPARKNNSRFGFDKPVKPETLKKMMRNRGEDGGFVAGWCESDTAADKVEGSIAHRRKEAAENSNSSNLEVISSHTSRGTGYYPPDGSKNYDYSMEGGPLDMRGAKLRTLQDYLEGKADYVSVAMDKGVMPYGTQVRIPELEQKYGQPIKFKLVDTGRAFRGKGTSKIDVCCRSKSDTYDDTLNGKLTVQFVRPGKEQNQKQKEADKPSTLDDTSEKSPEVQEQPESPDRLMKQIKQARLAGGLKPVVWLDSGHGGKDPGAVANGMREKDVNIDVTNRIERYLKEAGIVVERTNPQGEFVSLDGRADMSNQRLGEGQGRRSENRQGADAFISVHSNFSTSSSARGFETFASNEKCAGNDLACSIQDSVVNGVKEGEIDINGSLGRWDRGVKHKGFDVIKKSRPPAALTELGFLTNKLDQAILSDPRNREKLAFLISKGIVDFLDGRQPRQYSG